MTASSAMADVNTICQGGGSSGKAIRIELVHVLSEVGSSSEKASMNGESIISTHSGYNGEVLAFNLQTSSHVYGLDYNQLDGTAVLTGQGLNLNLYCSRR
ncbi:hypothetical protein D3C72_2290540 [compost metagenome]